MLKAIVFDYNGTLVDDLALNVEAYYRAGRELGFGGLTRETVLRHISQPPSQKRRLYCGEISDAQWEQVVQLRKKIYCELADPSRLLFPDTSAALTALSGTYTLAVLSNTFRSLYERLFPEHLAKLFQASLFFDEVPDPKPSPKPMQTMLASLGVDHHECGYAGDAVEDVQMAKAAGVTSFAITTGACSGLELSRAGADWVGANLKALAARLLTDARTENT
jgi:phosphoglycolate phosphatase-like HAD superfamily hydrolase